MAAPPPIVVWFRRELRLSDHEALAAAAASGVAIIPLYILDDETPGEFRSGGASRWWLHGSLASLDADLRRAGGSLCLRRGRAPDVLARLLAETRAAAVHATRGHEPWEAGLSEEVASVCRSHGAEFRCFPGRLLNEPEAMLAAGGKPYRVFTPFWRASLKREPPAPLPVPQGMTFAASASDGLDALGLLPAKPDWAEGLRETWTPGEAAALTRLEDFVAGPLSDYAGMRDRLDLAATSRLSPHLHFGELSPRQIWHAVTAAAASGADHRGAEAYLRELLWREFANHQLFHFPAIAGEPLRSEFSRFPWRDDRQALEAWQRGKTGYPIVDAAMRELWRTGYMGNRARMIVASFLTKHLLVRWQQGASWFLDTLLDADLASNATNWQWVTGSGVDAAPYFRIFNPVLQAQKFDPDGAYVRRWVPELAGLPADEIHAPWRATPRSLAAAGVHLGETYPNPIVDHDAARKRALSAFATLRR